MTPAEISTLTNAKVAERIAVVTGLRSDEYTVPFKYGSPVIVEVWADDHGILYCVDPGGEDHGFVHFSPATTPAQAMALLEGDGWPSDWGIDMCESDTIIIYDTAREVVVLRVERNCFPQYPTCRAICEAVLIAHEEKGETPTEAGDLEMDDAADKVKGMM